MNVWLGSPKSSLINVRRRLVGELEFDKMGITI